MAKSDGLKPKIYYARTYRHLKVKKAESFLYLLLLMLPSLFLLLLSYGTLTEWMCSLAIRVLQKALPGVTILRQSQDFLPVFGGIQMVSTPTVYPTTGFVLVNLSVTLFLLWLLIGVWRRIAAMSIYLEINLLVFVVNCAYFLFAGSHFPYTAEAYSRLYMAQQVGIWICFLIIAGLLTGFLGTGMLPARVVTVALVMLYSFVFGAVRYVLFLYILYRFSVLYMALFFFCLGPFFDFLYLVCICGGYLNHITKTYEKKGGREMWEWS